MSSNALHLLSRKDLYSLVNRLKREINCLETELKRFNILSKCYEKYLDFFSEINKKYFLLNHIQLTNDINTVKTFNDKKCLISLRKSDFFDDFSTETNELVCNEDNNEFFSQSDANEWYGEYAEEDNQPMDVLYEVEVESQLNGNNDNTNTEFNDYDINSTYETNGNQLSDNSVETNVKPIIRKSCQYKTCPEIDCNFKTKFNSILNKHKNKVHKSQTQIDEITGRFVCSWSECTRSYGKRTSLNRHYNTHIGKHVCDYPDCGFVSGELYDMKKHKRMHSEFASNGELMPCSQEDCQFASKYKTNFAIHLKCVHNIEDKANGDYRTESGFVCQWVGCEEVFDIEGDLFEHQMRHPINNYVCEWNGCEYRCEELHLFKEHMNRHEGKYPCDYPGCEYKARNSSLLKHHKRVHSGEKPFSCTHCLVERQFRDRKGLKKHQKTVHPDLFDDLPYFHCPESGCNFKTKFNQSMVAHRKSHNKPFECSICSSRFGKDRQLSDHMNKHTGLKPHVCPHCPESFANVCSLRNHVKTHQSKQFFCRFKDCNKSFFMRCLLNRHLRYHMNPKPVRCEWYGCERTFPSDSCMKDHMNIHTAQQSFACHWPDCQKSFLTKEYLMKHIRRTHKKLKEFECNWSECEYKTSSQARYDKHRQRHEEE